jgi:putative FmdB family regulatory protein
MPTYEYACKNCGEHLEVVQSFMDSALTECPACGGTLRKVFGNIGITFKGSGFYKTDSRSDGRKGASKPAEPKSSEAASDKGAGTAAGAKGEGPTKDGGAKDGGTKASVPAPSTAAAAS